MSHIPVLAPDPFPPCLAIYGRDDRQLRRTIRLERTGATWELAEPYVATDDEYAYLCVSGADQHAQFGSIVGT